ncbi:synaptic vesicle glycoprotein 2B [Culicoides brevitarsis]|uniref:synaptic vesicle glycoprotein 2B n=1 Tax=Culicoides brevitarsis TaxID=469753 RepID=UPI00307B8412
MSKTNSNNGELSKNKEYMETKNNNLESGKSSLEAADFETAISETHYGKFNYFLLLVALPACLSSQFDTSTMSYILSSAECDLNLDLVDKGNLNAVTYGGMIASAMGWGYLSDTLGRKKLLMYGYLLDGAINIFVSFSQTKISIMIFKFFSGFVICGPFAVLMSYLSELHGKNVRGRIMMAVGICFSVGNVLLPFIAWMILPLKFEYVLIENLFEIHTWQIFLAVCSIPPCLIAGILVAFLPESPKFLMSQGRNDEAMRVFRQIFSINTGKSPDSYPIKILVNEVKPIETISKIVQDDENPRRRDSQFVTNMKQFSVMFRKPHLSNSILVYVIQFGILFGLNSLRLWVPQLFSIISEYETDFPLVNNGGKGADLCTMMEAKVNKSLLMSASNSDLVVDGFEESICRDVTNAEVYEKAMILGAVTMVGYLITGSIINAVGNKIILIIGLIFSGSCGICLYFAKDSLSTLILSSLFVTTSSICSTALVSSTVSIFPTSLRTMIVSILMMFGRIGALLGNVMFPKLMETGCLPPFLMVGGTAIVCGVVCFLLPRTIKQPLK